MTNDDLDLDLDLDFNTSIARNAYKLGKELGKEARNAGRFHRGELEWEELSHAQKYLFLGGDRAEYEKIRSHLKNRQCGDGGSKSVPEEDTGNVIRRGSKGRFFDYENF